MFQSYLEPLTPWPKVATLPVDTRGVVTQSSFWELCFEIRLVETYGLEEEPL